MVESAKRRVLITGVSRFLGLRLAKRLEEDPSIEQVIGVDLEEPPLRIKGLEFIRVDIRNPLIARVVEATNVDSIVHTNILSRPGRLGGRGEMKENNVIGTMQLLAAAQRAANVKRVVMKSSTAVYGSYPAEPSLIPEDHAAAHHVDLAGYAKDCAEAETFARDFGRRRRDVDLVILRTQNVAGPTMRTNISEYLSLPVVPTALGFDPRLQLLHEEDAVEALYRSLMGTEGGIFNIAGDGVVYLSQAIRLLGRVPLPLLLPAAQPTAALLRRMRVIDFPVDQLKLIVFGRVVSTRRARERLQFAPRFTTLAALEDLKANRDQAPLAEPEARPTWERDLFEFIKSKASKQGVKV